MTTEGSGGATAGARGDAPQISGPAEAEALCSSLAQTMQILLELIEAETTLVRAGKLVAAGELEPRKSAYAKLYLNGLDLLRIVGPQLRQHAPEALSMLRGLHEEFRALLQIHMTALATARAAADAPRAPAAPARPAPTRPVPMRAAG